MTRNQQEDPPCNKQWKESSAPPWSCMLITWYSWRKSETWRRAWRFFLNSSINIGICKYFSIDFVNTFVVLRGWRMSHIKKSFKIKNNLWFSDDAFTWFSFSCFLIARYLPVFLVFSKSELLDLIISFCFLSNSLI